MVYSELIKSFERIRDYLRDFYIYGSKSRDEYDAKSARSYDNERRRIERWLGDYMGFRQNASGKSVFLSVDSRVIAQNPLYAAFRAKSFTALDITLHFTVLDVLAAGNALSLREILGCLEAEYFADFAELPVIDESTLRKKLKEYEGVGLIISEKRGKERLYTRGSDGVDLQARRARVLLRDRPARCARRFSARQTERRTREYEFQAPLYAVRDGKRGAM